MITSKIPNYSLLRPKKLPDKLIYKTSESYNGIPVDKFVMFSLKDPKKYATMTCFPSKTNREGKDVLSLYIWRLFSHPSHNGFGSALLDFAKKYSEQIGCNGYFHLCADVSFMPNEIPHIFYRKCGMSSRAEYVDKQLDSFIRKGKNATHMDFQTMDMLYPPIQHEHNESKFKKFCDKLFRKVSSDKKAG